MSGFSEMYAESQHYAFVNRWVPEDELEALGHPVEGARWWLARARAAESELTALKDALRIVAKASR